MPRFYFRLTDGRRSTEDRDGLDLVDQHSARREATQIVRDLLQEADETGLDWHGWEVQVLDATRFTRSGSHRAHGGA
jgi:uncharacterized NAD(P)/FAD-binding protein YdhS